MITRCPLRGSIGSSGVRLGAQAPAAFTTTSASKTPLVRFDTPGAKRADRAVLAELRTSVERLAQQPPGGTELVEHPVPMQQERSGEAGPEVGFSLGELGRVEQVDIDTARPVVGDFGSQGAELFFVLGNPQAAFGGLFAVVGHLRRELRPEIARALAEIELRGRVVHHRQVAHTGGGRAATGEPRVEQQDAQSFQ